MERFTRLLVLFITMMFGIIPVAKAQVSFDFHAPWMADLTADAGGAGSYYNESEYHDGYDQYCIDFNIGSTASYDKWYPVLAIADGTVTDTSVYYDYDVRIDHGDGYSSIYVHLAANAVTLNEDVKQGQVVGFIGNEGSGSGQSTGYHLHFCIYGSDGRTVMPSPMDGFELAENDAGTDVMSANDIRFLDRLTTELEETNPYSNSYIFLGSASGDIHWFDTTEYEDGITSPADLLSNGYARTLYIQDYDDTGWCDGAIVYDALGGARSAYIVQCQQWDTWISQDAPTIGPESFLGNPVTNVYRAGYVNYYQLFQGGYIRLNANGTVTTKTYTNGYAPGEMQDGSWNPQISYRFAETYESYGAHKKLGMPSSGVEQVGTDYYVQHFPGQQPRSDDDRYLIYGVEQQQIVKANVEQYNSLVASRSVTALTNVDDSATDTLDQDNDGYTPDDGDCNDLSNGVHPDHAELQDKVDNDCDGEVDNDLDADGYTIAQGDCNDLSNGQYPTHPELLDDRDNDCDSLVDDQGIELTSIVAADLSDTTAHPSCAVTTTLTSVVFNTTGGRIQQFTTSDGTSWSSLDLSAQAPVPYASPGTSPAIFIHPTTGERFVIFTGEDARIQLLRSNSGTWTSLDLTAQAAVDYADPDSSPMSYIDLFTEELHVVFTTEAGRIQQFTYNGNTWSSLDLSAQAAVQLAAPGSSPVAFVDSWTEERIVQFLGQDNRLQELVWNGISWTSLDLTSLIPIEYSAPRATPAACFDAYTGDRTTVFTGSNARVQLITYQGE